MELDIHRLLKILPQRPPYILIDRVTDLQPRQSAKGIKSVTFSDPVTAGYMPAQPMMPGVLVLEALSQLMAILVYASDPFDTNQKLMYFLGVDNCKFRRPVVPGDKLELEVELLSHRSNIWKIMGTASVGGKPCCQAELLAAVTDRGDFPSR